MDIDIVVPVWNRPVETRSCLVNLINHTPRARFILIDNGCDPETERLLHEFAESLEERALLISTGSNRGTIKAVNVGLQRVQAPYAAIVKPLSLVSPGWIEPLLALAKEKQDAGILVPSLRFDGSRSGGKTLSPGYREAGSGSLDAMVLRKELLDTVGGLDEGLDGGVWCLKDFSRRGYRAGFLTLSVATAPVQCKEEVVLGSVTRRAETERHSAALYAQRWGEEGSFAVFYPKETEAATFEREREVLLAGARHGSVFSLLVPHGLRALPNVREYERLHENLHVVPLPRFFTNGAMARHLAALRGERPETVAVVGVEGASFPGEEGAIPFSVVRQSIIRCDRERFGHSLVSEGA